MAVVNCLSLRHEKSPAIWQLFQITKNVKKYLNTSSLTNNQSSYAQLIAIAKLAGVVNANVGVAKEDEGINGICGDDISWDGDILADMELEFLQVQDLEAEWYSPLNRIGAKWPPRKTKKTSLLRGSGSDMGYQT